jgi:hypothetical protein
LTDLPPDRRHCQPDPTPLNVGVAGHRRHPPRQDAQGERRERRRFRSAEPARVYDLETLRDPTPQGPAADPTRSGWADPHEPTRSALTRRFTALPARRPIDRSTAGAGLAESPGTLRLALQSRLAEARRRASAPRCQLSGRSTPSGRRRAHRWDPRSRCRRASRTLDAGARQRRSPDRRAVLIQGARVLRARR